MVTPARGPAARPANRRDASGRSPAGRQHPRPERCVVPPLALPPPPDSAQPPQYVPGGGWGAPPSACSSTDSATASCGESDGEECAEHEVGPPAALHEVCRQIAELVTTLVRGLSGWQQRAAATRTHTATARKLLQEERRRAKLLQMENDRLVRMCQVTGGQKEVGEERRRAEQLELLLDSRLRQYSELLEEEERMMQHVRRRNDALERDKAALSAECKSLTDKVRELEARAAAQTSTAISEREDSEVAKAFRRLMSRDQKDGEAEPALHQGLVRVFVQQLRHEKRQRFQAEEQSSRMLAEQDKTIQNLEQRIRQLEASRPLRSPCGPRSPIGFVSASPPPVPPPALRRSAPPPAERQGGELPEGPETGSPPPQPSFSRNKAARSRRCADTISNSSNDSAKGAARRSCTAFAALPKREQSKTSEWLSGGAGQTIESVAELESMVKSLEEGVLS
eukprot:TRINITY_DN44290_c0_g1_i1.p1 TRINITY_DN44290_c0_g1~~TRINITY_DN44290_c0_g1_i1.p1  ORF type:complete len:453 (+),score=156.68 TRINITY_DN44290_c0_g1_i1:48-1406(+)